MFKRLKNMTKILNIVKIVFLFLIILFIIFFSIINSQLVKINFDIFPFNFTLEIRLFLLIIFCLVVGFLLGIATTSWGLLKKHIESIGNKKKLEKLEKQINDLNNKNIEGNNEK